MNILVLGSNGMAGHVISDILKKNHNVTTLARNNADININLDVNNMCSVPINSYDIIVNCIGTLVSDSNLYPDIAQFTNCYIPKFLEKHSTNSKIIHLSTDCVFSGKDGNYNELSKTDGDGIYSKTKICGEINNSKDLTIRTSIIGPELKNGTGFFEWVFNNKNKKINGYSNHIWNGLTTLQLAYLINDIICNRKNISGIVHIYSDIVSKYELSKLINEIYNLNINIEKFNDIKNINKSLTTNNEILNSKSIKDQLIELKQYMFNTDLYNKYR